MVHLHIKTFTPINKCGTTVCNHEVRNVIMFLFTMAPPELNAFLFVASSSLINFCLCGNQIMVAYSRIGRHTDL